MTTSQPPQPSQPPTAPAGHRYFGSDNYAGVHPEVLAALAAANTGHQVSYGADDWTARLTDVLSARFERAVDVYPVFTGTGANVVALQAMVPRWGAVICTEVAHINTDENAAPERVGGLKLLTVPAADGRLTPDGVAQRLGGREDEHRAQPGVVSLTQSTELGTCYTPDQVAALCDLAHREGLRVHMDGARLANAAATLGVPLRAFTADAGVDVVSLGGTKNGAMGAEAVVVLNPDAVDGVRYLRKIDMQLASKMRFMSAQLLALFEDDLWLRSAGHANAMATRLAGALAAVPGVRIALPVEANAVFAVLPPGVADRIRNTFHFYDWDGHDGLVRLMCAFDTTPDDVDGLAAAVAREAARG